MITRKHRIFYGLLFSILAIAVYVAVKNTASDLAHSDPIYRHADSPLRETSTKVARTRNERDGNHGNADSSIPPDLSITKKFNDVLVSDLKLDEKLEICTKIVREMASKKPFDEVMSFIDTNAGTGVIRGSLVTSLFQATNSPPDELISKFRDLDKSDVVSAQMGIYRNFATKENFQRNLGKLVNESAETFSFGALQTALSFDMARMGNPDSAKRRFQQVREIAESLPDDKKMACMTNIYKSLASTYPFDAWESLENEIALKEQKNSAFDTLKSESLQSMLSTSPRKTVEKLLTSEDSKSLQHSLLFWMNTQPKSLETWLQSNRHSLTSTQLIAYQGAVVDSYLSKQDFSLAKSSLNEISDPAARIAAEQKIRSSEEKQVVAKVNKDPQLYLDSIISDKLDESPDMLEPAFSAWIKKDSAKAQEWYLGNWDTLPKQKQQYIAAAYARSALETGDMNNASEWMKFIEDPKVISRLKNQIESTRIK